MRGSVTVRPLRWVFPLLLGFVAASGTSACGSDSGSAVAPTCSTRRAITDGHSPLSHGLRARCLAETRGGERRRVDRPALALRRPDGRYVRLAKRRCVSEPPRRGPGIPGRRVPARGHEPRALLPGRAGRRLPSRSKLRDRGRATAHGDGHARRLRWASTKHRRRLRHPKLRGRHGYGLRLAETRPFDGASAVDCRGARRVDRLVRRERFLEVRADSATTSPATCSPKRRPRSPPTATTPVPRRTGATCRRECGGSWRSPRIRCR